MGEAKRRKSAGTTPEWRTRIDPHITAKFGVAELHGVFFQPDDDRGGLSPAAMVAIPETPPDQVQKALEFARNAKARLGFLCDTAEQANHIAAVAQSALRFHRRVAYERAEAGGWGLCM